MWFDNSTLLGFQEKGKTAFLNMKNVQNLVDFFFKLGKSTDTAKI